jgi:hypothetical protein
LSYFHPGVNFNSEIADTRGPPVSRRSPCRACLSACCRRLAATCPRRALKALSGPRVGVPTAASRPRRLRAAFRQRAADRHATCAADRRCPLPTARVQSATPSTPTGHVCRLRANRRRASRAAPSSTPRCPDAAVADSTGKPWCRRLHRAVVYTTSSHRAAVHAPVRPHRAFPRTASRAAVTSSPQGTRATRLRTAQSRAAQAEAGPARPWTMCAV